MAELGQQQTVEFSTLVGRAAEESYLSLKELVDKSRSTEQSDSEKKISILKFLCKTQQRMLRLNVLAKWCQQEDTMEKSSLVLTIQNKIGSSGRLSYGGLVAVVGAKRKVEGERRWEY
ncbi:hypothetical protein RHGRI_010113 [Rhododendron griersonianum]|uniref:Mediator of RNA polymerase II transcription subunit 14 n=1 Tax=Rhododendron griersonianum TaxID=479676 RepID=A0AAV6KHI7_9ERIC|nr:hypothetical protein RHGRI_010113 [Rhododendron griersonianum]